MNVNKVFFLVCAGLLLFSCNGSEKKLPDVSKINSDVRIIRTEFELQNVHSLKDLDANIQLHPSFYKIYLNNVLGIDHAGNKDSLFIAFNEFIKDSLVSGLQKKVEKKYKDISKVKKDIDHMYQYLMYYFPAIKTVPDIYTYISDFAYQIFIFQDEQGRDALGLGLDMFMHPEIDYKAISPDNTNFSDYIVRTWNSDHIVKKIADLHVLEILGEAPGHRLIDQMIHNGKALYITDLLLPEVNDSIVTEYTEKQLDFCYKNELQIWSFFFDQKLFYESNPAKISKYINPSPKSPDMPDDAPGRTANFIGWQIVKAYMERFPETTLNELISMQDSQTLMEKSKYKPKQK